jgi:hypothetical protein
MSYMRRRSLGWPGRARADVRTNTNARRERYAHGEGNAVITKVGVARGRMTNQLDPHSETETERERESVCACPCLCEIVKRVLGREFPSHLSSLLITSQTSNQFDLPSVRIYAEVIMNPPGACYRIKTSQPQNARVVQSSITSKLVMHARDQNIYIAHSHTLDRSWLLAGDRVSSPRSPGCIFWLI